MRVGIDASNLRAGGTVTHLVELLRVAEPARFGFEEVWVWAGSAVLGRVEDRPWLKKCAEPFLEQAANPFDDRRHLKRAYWQRYKLSQLAKEARCDLLFVPGGMDNSGFRPMVAMSRNMLVFDRQEAWRYGLSASWLRLALLRRLQVRTFQRASGIIALTDYARKMISRTAGIDEASIAVIPHGVSSLFRLAPRAQRPISEFSDDQPFRILYVSTIDMYKHQWMVVDAVARLRARGLPVVLDLVGPANGKALTRLQETISSITNTPALVRYHGPIPYGELPQFYKSADLKVFASSCENMPNILLESMAAGLPIACSNRSPMPDVLGDAGIYFDPERPDDIADAVLKLIESPEMRSRLAALAYERAQQYSWSRCAERTLSFLAESARRWSVVRPR